jgi:hypothetical protein
MLPPAYPIFTFFSLANAMPALNLTARPRRPFTAGLSLILVSPRGNAAQA